MKDKEKNEAKNKGSKSNNNNLSLWLSVISLVGVATFAVLWICNVRPQSVVSLDSFVGVATGLIGIMVTFAIGWQIVNAMEIKNKIKEMDALREKLNAQQLDLQQTAAAAKADSMFALVILEQDIRKNYDHAFRYCMVGLFGCISIKEPSSTNIDVFLSRMEISASKYTPTTPLPQELYPYFQELNRKIRSSNNYTFIAHRYEPAFNLFMSKAIAAKNHGNKH